VPVHDVGLDERGYFFVMKYLDGETLETIIERLREGDPRPFSEVPHEARAQLFLQLCQACSTPTTRASSTATSSPPT
jgi:hypothetical protein